MVKKKIPKSAGASVGSDLQTQRRNEYITQLLKSVDKCLSPEKSHEEVEKSNPDDPFLETLKSEIAAEKSRMMWPLGEIPRSSPPSTFFALDKEERTAAKHLLQAI